MEERRQKTEVRSRRTEDGSWKLEEEDRRQKMEEKNIETTVLRIKIWVLSFSLKDTQHLQYSTFLALIFMNRQI